jgi:hypothetical protein
MHRRKTRADHRNDYGGDKQMNLAHQLLLATIADIESYRHGQYRSGAQTTSGASEAAIHLDFDQCLP